MHIDQVSVFLENRPGRLKDVCALLEKNGIDIKTLCLAESKDFGVLRMIVDKTDEALDVLKAASFAVDRTDIVCVEVPDTPGGLLKVLDVLAASSVNLEYMYGFTEKCSDKALMVFRFDDTAKAAKVLITGGIRVVRNTDLAR
jgi:hypothetical protein